MYRLHTLSALALTLTLVLAACSGPPRPADDASSTPADAPDSPATTAASSNTPQEWIPIEQRDMGDWIFMSLDAEPAHLNQLLDTSDAEGANIMSFIFETMLDVDPETLDLIPYIAKSWEISDDKKTYTFHLRDDVHFSDGVPLTAHDIKFTNELINDPKNDTLSIRNYQQDIESVEVIDDYTIKYTMKRVYYRHLLVLGLTEIYPKHIYSGGDFNNHPHNRSPVGSGPYIFEKWDTGQQIVLTRNENYWKAKQPIEKRIWKVITDDNAAFQALERGDTDIYRVKPDDWTRKASRPEFEAKFNKFTPDSPIPGYFSRYNYIAWNTRKPQFEDKRVRQALCMLFDRQLVIDTVWAGLGTVITGPMYHKTLEYNQDITPWPFDPKRAAELLAEAGWADTDRDGILDKDGVKLEFELSYASGVQEYDRLSTVYQEELKRVGINMKINPLEWASFIERIHNRNFDACMLAWLTPIMQDPYQLWHSSQAEEGSNYPGFKNAEADDLLQTARESFERKDRIEKYHRLHEILHEEQPYLFLYARPGLIAFEKRIHGIVEHNAGVDPRDWWVPAAMQKYK
jgi:peptide/nickel transport system substrate-binding protein